MDSFFFDTSAIAKRYIIEAGTPWIQSLTAKNPNRALFLANITAVEVTSAIVRRQKGGSISPTDAATALANFRSDWMSRYHILNVSAALVSNAEILAERKGLRAYDAVQLAVLLELDAQRKPFGVSNLTLISADVELNAAAATEGIAVDDPNSHP